MPLILAQPPAIIVPAPRKLLKPRREILFTPAISFISSGRFGAAAPPSLEFRTSVIDTTSLTTYSFAGVDIGGADPTRRVIVAASINSGSSRSTSSVTIAGVGATLHTNVAALDHVSLSSAQVAAGTTATISVTFSGGGTAGSIGVWRLVNETVGTPHATATDIVISGADLSVSLNVPTNGALVASVCDDFTGGTGATAWTGAIEKYDSAFDSVFFQVSGASETGLSLQTGRTVTATCSGTSPRGSLAVLTWG